MDKAKRKAIIAGNWKMNKTASEAAVPVSYTHLTLPTMSTV